MRLCTHCPYWCIVQIGKKYCLNSIYRKFCEIKIQKVKIDWKNILVSRNENFSVLTRPNLWKWNRLSVWTCDPKIWRSIFGECVAWKDCIWLIVIEWHSWIIHSGQYVYEGKEFNSTVGNKLTKAEYPVVASAAGIGCFAGTKVEKCGAFSRSFGSRRHPEVPRCCSGRRHIRLPLMPCHLWR